MADDESTEEKTTTAPAAPPAAVVQGGGGDDGQLVAEEDVMDQEMQQIMRGMSHMRSCDSEEAGESDRPNPFVSVAKRVPETDSTVYTLLRFNMGFHLPNKYAPPNGNVALGAFAKVVFSRDLTRPPTPVDDYQFEGHSQQVAIKKLRRFHDADEALRAYRELLILRHLREHDNIVALRDFFLLPGDDSLLDYYIVTEYCGNTLDQVMLGDLDPMDVQMIAYSILRGVKYIHSAGLTHRDLKPNNVLIDVDTVKIIDFGYAKRDRGRFPYMQAYMQCRDYRAPELFLWLQASEQDNAVHISGQQLDMWSIGVMITEMMLGRALFPAMPSDGDVTSQHKSHMCRLISHLGPPPQEYFLQFPESHARRTLIDYASRARSQYLWDELEEKAQQNSDDDVWANVVPLSRSLLSFGQRPTAEEAIALPFFGGLSDPSDEPSHSELFDDSFEEERGAADLDHWHQRLRRLAETFHAQP